MSDGLTKQLTIVAHCPSPNTRRLAEAVLEGANSYPAIVQSQLLSPFDVDHNTVLKSDALILGTTENLGYMSGALKDFFDRIYYPVLDQKQGLPVASYIRAGHDGTGTQRALSSILTGLRWRWVQDPLILRGEFSENYVEQCFELGAAMSAALEEGMI